MSRRPQSTFWIAITFYMLGLISGMALSPRLAHAGSDYSASLVRLVRAAERIADTLDKAAR